MRLLQQLFDFERQETTGERLFYRVFELVMLYWTLYFMWTWGFYILRIGEVVLPLGIAAHIDISFMFVGHRPLFNAGAVTVLMLLGFFRLWRYGYLLALLLFHVQYVSRFCLGEISHGSNVIGLAVLGMSLGALFFRNRQVMHRFVIGFNYFFLGLGYTSAALCKLIGTGPGWVDGRHMWLWINERAVDTFSITGSLDFNWIQTLALDWYPVATMILTFGLLTELFGFLAWFRRSRPYIMVLLLVMHIGILLSMKINFPANNAIIVLLAFPWSAWIDQLLRRLDAPLLDRVDRLSLRFV